MTCKSSTNHTITFSISESIYDEFMKNTSLAHELIKKTYDTMPELFPVDLSLGYKLNGRTRCSKKMEGFQMRKIKVQGKIYQLHPSFLIVILMQLIYWTSIMPVSIFMAFRFVLQKRMKQSGQKWTKQGGQAVANLRVFHLNNQWGKVIRLINEDVCKAA